MPPADPPAPAPPPAGERIPLGLLLAFGAPTFASAALVIPIGVHLPKFYADEALVPLGLLGIAIAVARAFDAITDPLMGWLSDRTRGRWGRRRPYIALGAPLCAVSLWLLFSPPASLTTTQATLWFGASFVLYYLFHTIYLVPHLALGAELSLDYHERSRLFGVREAFLVGGTLCASLAPLALIRALGDERAALSAFAAIFGALLVVLYLWLVVRARERPEFQERTPGPLAAGIRRCLRNGPFALLLVTSVLSAIPGVLSATLLRFFIEEVLRPEDPGRWLALMLGTYFAMAFASLPVWLRIAKRSGKKPAWLASFVFCGSGSLPMFFLGEGDMWPMLACIAWAGAGFGAISALSLAIKADVIDYDELVTGKRREGQFGAFWSFLPKFVQIPGAAIPVALLGSLGYVPHQIQGPEVVFAIKAMMGLTPALCFGLALWVGRRLQLDAEVHRAILEGVAAHARGEPAYDPVRGCVLPPPGRHVPEETSWFLDHFSRAELERVLRDGPARLPRDVLVAAGAMLALCAALSAFVASSVSDLASKPGVGVVAGVTFGGLALAVGLFHLLRLRPALRMRRTPVPAELVAAHLREVAGGNDLAAPDLATEARASGPAAGS